MKCGIWKMCVTAAAAVLALLFAGCRSDCTSSAVEDARAYALEHLRGITEEQREFIRFTEPEIFENVIYPRYVIPLSEYGHLRLHTPESFPTAPFQDLMHSCVVWAPPGLDAYVVVFGDGERSMRFWTPRRVMIRKYFMADPSVESAKTVCRDYAQNGMLYLSTAERNRLRFADPETVRYTKLDVAPLTAAAGSDFGKSEWERYLEELEDSRKPAYQLSMIWAADDPEQKIVFTGLTRTGSFSGWQLQTAELMPLQKLKDNLLTEEEEAQIPKPKPLPRKLQYSTEKEIERHGIKDSPDTPLTGGSVIVHY